MKADLKRLDEYFSAQPAEVLECGVMYFEPPFDGDYLTTRLWKQFLPGWRDPRAREDIKLPPERAAELVEEFNRAIKAPEGSPVGIDQADFVAMQRLYPVKMGKWQIVPETSRSVRGRTKNQRRLEGGLSLAMAWTDRSHQWDKQRNCQEGELFCTRKRIWRSCRSPNTFEIA